MMGRQKLYDLMASSRSPEEWNTNADHVVCDFGGRYPSFWHMTVMESGLANRLAELWATKADPKDPNIMIAG